MRFHRRQHADTRFPGKAQTAVTGQIQGALLQGLGQRIHFRKPDKGHLGSRLPLDPGAAEPVAVNEPDKFQLLEQVVEHGLVVGLFQSVHGGKVDGGLGDNGGQLVRKVGAFFPVFQLLPELGPDGAVGKVLVYPVQGAEFQQKVRGGFLPHTGHPGDIVGGIAHQGLQVDEASGFKAVFLPEFLLVIEGGAGLTGPGDHQLHMDVFVNELQTVPVAGDNDALPAIVGADFAHGADDIIRLPPFTGIDGNVHGGEHLLHNGHLLGQLLRHAVAGGLVALIALMAEGGAVEVEGHADRVRLLLLLHPLQNVQESIYGMGEEPLPGGQGLDPEVGPVDDAVAVQDH